jgi:hypothetical protein
MKTVSRITLVIFFLALTIHRLPAPISEEAAPTPSATVRPKAKALAKPKPKTAGLENSQQTQTRSKQSPFAPFAGTWTGTVTSVTTFTIPAMALDDSERWPKCLASLG